MAEFGYLGNPNLKRIGEQIEWTPEMVQEFVKCRDDPVYFARKYIKVVHVDKGFIPLNMYPYQEEITEKIFNHRRVTVLTSRQAGKTTTAVAVILHYMLFNTYKSVALLANKGDSSQEIMARIQLAYEALPKWIQQGIITWNKRSIELENGCKVFAAATSSSSIRGKSCITADTRVCVENGDDYHFVEIGKLIDDNTSKETMMYYAAYKTVNDVNGEEHVNFRYISDLSNIKTKSSLNGSIFSDGYMGSGELMKSALIKYGPMNMHQELLFVIEDKKEDTDLINILGSSKILTPSGFSDFSGFIPMGNKPTFTLRTSIGELRCTDDHRFMLNDGTWVEAQHLTPGVLMKGGVKFVSLDSTGLSEEVYDALNVVDGHAFYAEGVIAHNCNLIYIDEAAFVENWDEFFQSTYPTISSGETTKLLLTSTPNGLNHFWNICMGAKEGTNGYEFVEVGWERVPGRGEAWKKETMEALNHDEQKFLQEYCCVFGESEVDILDEETGETFKITMEKLYQMIEAK